jgi:hypothetical protein
MQGQRGFSRLNSLSRKTVPVGAQMVVVLKAFGERCILLVCDYGRVVCWFVVSQTDLFHCSSHRSSLLGSPAVTDFSVTVSGNEAQQILI